MQVTKFTGYSSVRSGITKDISKSSKLINLMINKGNLCNLPYFTQRLLLSSQNSHRIFVIYRSQQKSNDVYLVIFLSRSVLLQGQENSFLHQTQGGSNAFFSFNIDLINFWSEGFDPRYSFSDTYHLGLSKFFQVGKWLYMLALTKDPFMAKGNTPRMLKILPKLSNEAQSIVQLAGLKAPRKVVFDDFVGSGALTGSYSFAFSFKQKTVYNDVNGERVYAISESDRMESNVMTTSPDALQTFAAQNAYYKVYTDIGTLRAEPYTTFISIYVRNSNQVEWYWVEDVSALDNIIFTDPNDSNSRYFRILVSNVTQTVTRLAEFVKRAIPLPSAHACVFKDRMYWLNTAYENSQQYWPVNQIQYSQIFRTPGTDVVDYTKASYIEDEFLLGDASYNNTGAIEFLGQLILFKENKTYVLTDDILNGGELRVLFEDKGCVNKLAGNGYIIIDSKLYFAAYDGIYMYNGANDPVKISMDIQEDLDKIPSKLYQNVRFGTDSRYGLLYVMFPAVDSGYYGVHPSFIYHCNELNDDSIGYWTTYNAGLRIDSRFSPEITELNPINVNANLVQVESVVKDIVYFVHNDNLFIAGNIDDPSVHGSFPARIWMIQTSLLTLNDGSRDKQFNLFKLEADFYTEFIANSGVFSILPLVKLTIADNRDLRNFQQFDLSEYGEFNVSKIAKQLLLQIVPYPNVGGDNQAYNDLWFKPFRIFGWMLDVNRRGRR